MRPSAMSLLRELPPCWSRSPWERPTNENTNGLIRENFPKGATITDYQPYLDAVARELNNRPRPAWVPTHTEGRPE